MPPYVNRHKTIRLTGGHEAGGCSNRLPFALFFKRV